MNPSLRKSLVAGSALLCILLVSTVVASLFLQMNAGVRTPASTNTHDELRTLGWTTLVNITRGGDPPPTVQWDNTYGGTGNDTGQSAVETSDGGFVMAANTNSFGVTTQQAWLVRTDSTGGVIWNYTYGGTGGNAVEKIIAAGDGGFVVAGFTNSTAPVGYTPARGAGGYDVWLFKVSSTGSLSWEKLFGGSADDYAFDVEKTSDGGYILAGATASVVPGELCMFLVRTDSDGNQQWNSTISRTGDTVAYSVTPTSDGAYVVAGYTTMSGTDDLLVVKTDAFGHEANGWMLEEPGVDVAHGVVQTSDGGYAVEAITNSYGAAYKIWLLKFNSALSLSWDHLYGTSYDTFGYSLLQAADGGLLVAGSIRNASIGPQDVFIMKADTLGNQIWNMTFGGAQDDIAYSIRPTSGDGYIVAATTDSFSASNDAWLIELESDFFIYPYVQGGSLNATVIVGVSDPHGPSGAANTLDTVGGMEIAEMLGAFKSSSYGAYFLDTDVSKYNFTTGTVYYSYPNVTNVITVGGPGVNQITYKYFMSEWWNDPVYWAFNGSNKDIVTPSHRYYPSDWVSPGRDLAVIESVYAGYEGRYVMMAAGFGGDGTRAAALILQLYGSGQLPFTLQGRAMLVQWIDANSNAKVDPGDTFNVIEIIP